MVENFIPLLNKKLGFAYDNVKRSMIVGLEEDNYFGSNMVL
jgi:hypothetical protein